MDIEEAKKMEGTEFTYEFEDGDTIRAYVKKFDPDRGLSCWSFSLETDGGQIIEILNEDEDKEGACCLIGFDFTVYAEDLPAALDLLEGVKNTGRFTASGEKGLFFTGCPL
jgi:hypothetical protein